jgi:hypothetical protein
MNTGLMAVGYALAMARNPRRWLPAVLVVQLGMEYLGRHLFGVVTSPLSEGDLAARLRFDATASIVTLFPSIADCRLLQPRSPGNDQKVIH